MTTDGTVLVVAKAPRPGRSKTRLVPPLTPETAAELQTAMLLDTLDACRAEVADVRILYASDTDAGPLSTLAPGVPLVRQQGVGLAEALEGGIAAHVGGAPCAVVSSDVPGLPRGELRRAFEALANGADAVLGPALDGGYWLLALREAHAAPFADIPWSTPAVLAVTRRRCEAAGLSVVELEPWRDVDTAVDLAAVAERADDLPGRRTAELARTLRPLLERPAGVELVASEVLDASQWRVVLRDTLRVDGRPATYTYLGVERAVFVAALTAAGDILLVRQYRHPVRDWTIEVPAGSVRDGEQPLDAARRELREETGATGGRWTHLTTFFSSSAHLSLRSDAFLAEDVEPGRAHPDDGEDVTVVSLPFATALERARAGGFPEGQTALTILLAAARRR
jgi:hypothetical protein